MPEKEPERKEGKKAVSMDRPKTAARLNPRLCFGNPDAFFHDLLTEKEEQG